MQKVCEVVLSQDAYLVCMQHVHTTDGEEVMGLLVGRYHDNENTDENCKEAQCEGDVVCNVTHAVILRRSDKRKDRVEISPEMLIQAQQKAEDISRITETSVNIVGWYHSHPKITVAPSAVDLHTQMGYQQMDHRFVGIIFSVFNKSESSKVGEVVVGGFQAVEAAHGRGCERINVPVTIKPEATIKLHNQEAMFGLSNILQQEQLAVLQLSRELHALKSPLQHLYNSAVAVQRVVELCELQAGPLCSVVGSRAQRLGAHNALLDQHIHYLGKLIRDRGIPCDLQL
ncbi:JAB1/MPN/MOV34 metalloenzyme domain [Trinorchestia longiramus]|nr:JAB1/MPN/MOV34 metalloenzyme domain [Trinorchestia longiramus]